MREKVTFANENVFFWKGHFTSIKWCGRFYSVFLSRLLKEVYLVSKVGSGCFYFFGPKRTIEHGKCAELGCIDWSRNNSKQCLCGFWKLSIWIGLLDCLGKKPIYKKKIESFKIEPFKKNLNHLKLKIEYLNHSKIAQIPNESFCFCFELFTYGKLLVISLIARVKRQRFIVKFTVLKKILILR